MAMAPDDYAIWATWATLAIYNVAIVRLLTFTLKNANIAGALVDKDAMQAAKTSSSLIGVAAPNVAGVAGAPVAVVQAPPNPADFTSSSRIAVMAGMTVLACLLWAVGNACLFKVFASPDAAKAIAKGLWPLFLAGSALFAPYAFNQLKGVFT